VRSPFVLDIEGAFDSGVIAPVDRRARPTLERETRGEPPRPPVRRRLVVHRNDDEVVEADSAREGDRFVAVTRDVECDRRRADDLAAQRVVAGGDLQGPSTELRRGPRAGRHQGLRRIEERGEGHLVAGLGARRQLRRHLDRERAAPHQDLRRPAVERTTSRGGDRPPNGSAGDVVPERQAFSPFDEQVRFQEFGHRCEQRGRLPAEGLGELREREGPTE